VSGAFVFSFSSFLLKFSPSSFVIVNHQTRGAKKLKKREKDATEQFN
jgi:hypothetical protein